MEEYPSNTNELVHLGSISCKTCRATIASNFSIKLSDERKMTDIDVLKVYDYARLLIKANGFEEELSYLTNLLKESKYKSITITDFFKEYIWVPLTTHMSIRSKKLI